MREKGLTAAVDFLCIYLIALGMYTAYISVSYWELPIATCLWYVLVPVIAYFLLSIRWWIAPALLAVIAFAIYIWLRETDNIEPLLEYIRYYIDWLLIKGAPPDEYIKSMNGDDMLLFGVAVLMSLLVFIMVRYTFSFILILAANVTFFILLLTWRDVDIILSILLSVAGLIILLPRIYVRHFERKKRKQGKKDGIPESKTPRVSRVYMQLFAIPIAALVVLLFQLVIPQDTSGWKSEDLNYLADDISNMIDPFGGEVGAGAGSNFSLSSVGFQPNNGALGGPVSPSSARVLQIESIYRPPLFKGAVFDEYTGTSWRTNRDINDGDIRFNGLNADTYRSRVFAGKNYSTTIATELYEILTERAEYEVTYLNDRNTTIFNPGWNPSFDFEHNGLEKQIYFNMRGETYNHRRFPAGTTMTVQADTWRYRTESFDEDFVKLEQALIDEPDEAFDGMLERYTDVPAGLKGRIERMFPELGLKALQDGEEVFLEGYNSAGGFVFDENTGYGSFVLQNEDDRSDVIIGGNSPEGQTITTNMYSLDFESMFELLTPYQKAVAIRKYLTGNFTYTLTPSEVPPDVDFVEHFFNTREGYCTYYASAMVMMARTAGIPARYVTGFGLTQADIPAQSEVISFTYFALNSTAHAWAELYFEGIGWVDFDPLGWNDSEANPNVNFEGMDEAEPTPSPTPEAATPTPAPIESEDEQNLNDAENARFMTIVWVSVSVIVLILAALIFFRIRRGKSMNKKLESGERTPSQKMDILFKDIMLQLRILGIKPGTGDTLFAFAWRVDKEMNRYKSAFADIARIQVNSKYGEIPPTEAEFFAARKYHESLEERVQIRLGKFKYFIKRGKR